MSSSPSSSPLSAWRDRVRSQPKSALILGGVLTTGVLAWVFFGSWRWRDVLLYGVLVGGLLPGLMPRPRAPTHEGTTNSSEDLSSSPQSATTTTATVAGDDVAVQESGTRGSKASAARERNSSALSLSLPGAMHGHTPSPSSHVVPLPQQQEEPNSAPLGDEPWTPLSPVPVPASLVPPISGPGTQRVASPPPSTDPRMAQGTRRHQSLSSSPSLKSPLKPLQPSNLQPPTRSSTSTSLKPDILSPGPLSLSPSPSFSSSPSLETSSSDPRSTSTSRRSSGAFHRLEAGVRETKRLLRRVKPGSPSTDGVGKGVDGEKEGEEGVGQDMDKQEVVERLEPGAIPIDVYRNALARAELEREEDY